MSDSRERHPENTDPVKRITGIVLVLVMLMLLWYVVADRFAPWTDQARVQTYIIPVVPQVSGRVTAVKVSKDQEVHQGDVLLKIEQTDYLLAVEQAEADLELAGQEIGASTASVTTAQAKVVEARANVDHLKAQSRRVLELEKKKIYSKARGDKARAAVVKAEAQLVSAKAELEKARQALGQKGAKNPKIRAAMARLKKAQIDLSRTVLLAPAHGGITNLKIDVGYYAQAGTPIMTFVEADNAWIKANLRENSMSALKPGTPVDIVLDAAPGRVFQGQVSSIGFAVNHEKGGEVGGLESIEHSAGWLRDAQRFPVYISFLDNQSKASRRLGGQADVQFYATDNTVINALGWVWIRLLSWFSYLY